MRWKDSGMEQFSIVGTYRHIGYKRQRLCDVTTLPDRGLRFFTYIDDIPTGDHFRTMGSMRHAIDNGEVVRETTSKSYDDVQRERREAKQKLNALRLQDYTVVGYWGDTGQAYVGHVDAIDVDEACLVARIEAGIEGCNSLAIVAVFDGHHADLSI